ncbi:hypothetical protein Tco_0477402, partial [Tanacetum coccineum]
MSTSIQQTLTDSRANYGPLMLERGNYIPWPMIPNPDDTEKQILKPLSKMTTANKSQYIADVKVMNYLLQAIPNNIYNSVDYPKKKKAAKNHDPLALLIQSNASSSHSHANSSYSPQPYYVTHPSLVVDYEDEYQGKLQGDSQEDKLITAMMLLARAITQKFPTPTNNRLRTSSNTRNQAVIQDGRVDVQTKNAGYGGNGNKNAGRQNRNQAFNVGSRNDERNQIVQHVPRTESTSERQMFSVITAMKKATMPVIVRNQDPVVARIKPADGNVETVPTYDAKVVSEVNASSKVHEQVSHVKCKTIIQTSVDDQIDSNIIFDDPYVENNGRTSEHDSNAHDEYHEIQMLAYN